jgi:hypothetical protein
MNGSVKFACLAALAILLAPIADPAAAKQRVRRCVCPEKTEYEPPCEGRTVYTTYVRRVVEPRLYVEPVAYVAAPAVVAYPAYGYAAYPAYGYGYPYGYAYGGSGIVDAGFGVGYGGWGW